MPKIQEYLAEQIESSAKELLDALLNLPEEKRNWKPATTSRSALDQIAEAAILNGNGTKIIQDRQWNEKFDFAGYTQRKAELAEHWSALKSLFDQNTSQLIATVRSVPDEDLDTILSTPFGALPMTKIMTYPYWNMSYHTGQINYIASILGCL